MPPTTVISITPSFAPLQVTSMLVTMLIDGRDPIVKVIFAVAARQAPAGSSEVMVSVIRPARISAAEGVYVAFGSVASSNVPFPDVVQLIVDEHRHRI